MVLACLVGLAPLTLKATQPAPPAKAVADAPALLKQARAAYIGLSAKGFRGYRFVATPDWPLTLTELAKTNPAGYEAAVSLLRRVRFEVRVGAHGNSQVVHNFVDSPNETSASGMNQVYQGVEQAINGFFQTWAPFMVQVPLPPEGTPCKVEDRGTHYQMSWEEQGGIRVDLRLDRTFAVLEMTIASPSFDAVIRPTFERPTGGFVIIAYDAEYTPKQGGAAMTLKVLITNQSLEGLPVPSALDLSVLTQGRKERMTFAFSELKAEPK